MAVSTDTSSPCVLLTFIAHETFVHVSNMFEMQEKVACGIKLCKIQPYMVS